MLLAHDVWSALVDFALTAVLVSVAAILIVAVVAALVIVGKEKRRKRIDADGAPEGGNRP